MENCSSLSFGNIATDIYIRVLKRIFAGPVDKVIFSYYNAT